MEQDHIVKAELDEEIKRELAGAMRWCMAQVILGFVCQALLAVMVFSYLDHYFKQRHLHPSLAFSYLRLGSWLLFNIGCNIVLLFLVLRYYRTGMQAIALNSQWHLRRMFRYMRKAAFF